FILSLSLPVPPTSIRFPYTTLFRSHVQSLVAEMLGQAGGIGRALQAQQRRYIGRSRHDHRARQSVGAQVVFDEFLDFAAALADEDRKSTRLNSSHVKTSYAVFCLKK